MSNVPNLLSDDSGKRPKLRPPKKLLQQSTPSNSLEVNSPNTTTRDEKPHQNSKPLNLQELVANSTLNAAADEWYPKSSYTDVFPNQPVVNSSVQSRLKKFKVPQNHINNECSTDEGYKQDLNRIKQIISTVTRDPGQFHDLLDLFMETLDPYLDDIMIQSLVAEIIVEQAINYPNFRYTAAKLCWYIEQQSAQFRVELHLKCKKQIEENLDTKNVLPLIAELYTQLPHLNMYGMLLIIAFRKLLDLGSNEDIKSICQALKLTGYSLEQSNKSDLDKIFHDLRLVRGTLDGSAVVLLESIYKLRASNWGHSTEESDSEQEDMGFDGLQGKVVYDVEGETLTTEESDFITSHLYSQDDYDIDDFDPDELCDPEPEMDEEIQEAFKEFVKLSGKQ